MFKLFAEISIMLQKDEDFDEEEIMILQDKMDSFCLLYKELFGTDAVTNYIHLWAAGHIRSYL